MISFNCYYLFSMAAVKTLLAHAIISMEFKAFSMRHLVVNVTRLRDHTEEHINSICQKITIIMSAMKTKSLPLSPQLPQKD